MDTYLYRYAAGIKYFVFSVLFLAALFFTSPAKAAEPRELTQNFKANPVQVAYYARYWRPYYRPYYYRPYYRPIYYRPYYYHWGWRRW